MTANVYEGDLVSGYFVDDDGVIYSLYDDGGTNCPSDLDVDESSKTVSERSAEGNVVGEYTLYTSLRDLAAAVEPEGVDQR